MSFKKKTSEAIETAKLRLSGLKSIEGSVDLGNGIGNQSYEEKIRETETALESYNTLLSHADQQRNIFEQKERELMDISKRILAGVAVKYGYDSNEYEKAGGTRTSDRKKPVKQSTPAA